MYITGAGLPFLRRYYIRNPQHVRVASTKSRNGTKPITGFGATKVKFFKKTCPTRPHLSLPPVRTATGEARRYNSYFVPGETCSNTSAPVLYDHFGARFSRKAETPSTLSLVPKAA